MKRTFIVVTFLACLGVASCERVALKHGDDPDDNELKDLPKLGFAWKGYKIDPFLRVASQLQKSGREKAIAQLTAFSEDINNDEGAIVLCKMLFTQKQNSGFRRPYLGRPCFIDGTFVVGSPWPLEPIELVDGVPFLVVTGYILGGQPERALHYLDYCAENCDWSKFEFQPKTRDEKTAALTKLLSAISVKEKIGSEEIKTAEEFFKSQIE